MIFLGGIGCSKQSKPVVSDADELKRIASIITKLEPLSAVRDYIKKIEIGVMIGFNRVDELLLAKIKIKEKKDGSSVVYNDEEKHLFVETAVTSSIYRYLVLAEKIGTEILLNLGVVDDANLLKSFEEWDRIYREMVEKSTVIPQDQKKKLREIAETFRKQFPEFVPGYVLSYL
jgi:cell division protein ZapA (FtsZ GTPase activity inhibitor)